MKLRKLFEVTASEYWDDHFVFGKKSRSIPKNTGTQATDIFLINAVVPVIFVYGQSRDYGDICERALIFLRMSELRRTCNHSEWKTSGIRCRISFLFPGTYPAQK